MKNQGVNWICRELIASPYCIGLCLEEGQFQRELRRLKVPRENWPVWVPEKADARVHLFARKKTNDLCAIVCVRPQKKPDQSQIIGLLVHEAVHVWQEICEHISEYNPSKEFEAYSIQSITQRLIAAYVQIDARLKKK